MKREAFLGIIASFALMLSTATLANSAECKQITSVDASYTIETYNEASDLVKLKAAAQTSKVAGSTQVVIITNPATARSIVYYLDGQKCILTSFPASNVDAVFQYYGIGRQKGA